jgi:hypothetical protein
MDTKRWNWRLWAGFVLSVLALVIYVSFFAANRNIFWLSLLLFIVAAALLVSGLRLALGERETYRGKVAGPILASLSFLVLGIFGWASYQVFTKTPSARLAPQIGQKAPEFSLTDANGTTVTLTQVLATPVADASGAKHPAKGVLVVFYRGYW